MTLTLDEWKQALEKKELFFLYQAKVSYPKQHVLGFEALVRWNHPTKGILTPFHFDSFLSHPETVHAFNQYVIHHVLEETSHWPSTSPLRIAINLSPTTITPSLLTFLFDRLQSYPHTLEVELLENERYVDVLSLVKPIVSLREGGVWVSLDDFGSYTDMEPRILLPLHSVKLDRSLLKDWRKLHEVMNWLKQTPIQEFLIEGVETETEWKRLKWYPIHAVQGYYIQKPSHSDEVVQWLHS